MIFQDGTGKIVDDYIDDEQNKIEYTVDIIHRKTKSGLSSAILDGIEHSSGETIVVMDSDFSHPPKIIPRLIEEIKISKCDIVIASRFVTGGAIEGWSRFISIRACNTCICYCICSWVCNIRSISTRLDSFMDFSRMYGIE